MEINCLECRAIVPLQQVVEKKQITYVGVCPQCGMRHWKGNLTK